MPAHPSSDADEARRSFLLRGGALAAGTVLTGPVTAAPRTRAGPEEKPAKKNGQESTGASEPAAAGADGITRTTVAAAEKLAVIEFTDEERGQIVETIEGQLDRARRRRGLELPNGLGPAQKFDPRLPGLTIPSGPSTVVPSRGDAGPVPSRDEDIAFAPVTALAQWIGRRQLTSAHLTEIYLQRLQRYGPALECVVSLTADLARRQAARADQELAAGGKPRGPLHGIPWGAKDLFDTAGIRTTWGAAPYRDRVGARDASVVQRLEEAGAVLVAKLTLGALAYGDIWFGGKTRNPFNREQGSSGSSAGPAAATTAGLVGFGLGTETLGSIVSPSMRCGTTGLRPTFGRVSRAGAMALCWSLDKIGPLCRTAEDTALVLGAIHGADAEDPSSVDVPFHFEGDRSVKGLRLGYDPAWFEGPRVRDLDRRGLEAARAAGAEMVEIELPDRPYGTLMTILLAEAAAAFEPLTRSGRDDEMVWQKPEAWPNTFRRSWFIPAIEYVQAERFRREVCAMMAGQFEHVDAMISPSYAGSLLLITNHTGHPSLTLRCGFKKDGTPHGITLWGRLYDEGTLVSLGMAMEKQLGVWDRRPVLEEG